MISLEKIQDFNYEGQRLLFEKSKRLEYERFTIMFIEEFEDDYLNLAINIKSKNAKEFEEDFIKIKEIMNKNKRKASVFINNKDLLNTIDFKAKGLEISDNVIWLIKEDVKEFIKIKTDFPIDIVKIENKQEKQIYPYYVEKGFTKRDEKDPYDGLSKSVLEAIKKSCYNLTNNRFITEHYIAKYREEVVGTITIMYEKEIAYIYNVTTNINYRRRGICNRLMATVLERLASLNVKQAVLQTEKGFYPEKIYKNMGFKELFEGVKYTEI